MPINPIDFVFLASGLILGFVITKVWLDRRLAKVLAKNHALDNKLSQSEAVRELHLAKLRELEDQLRSLNAHHQETEKKLAASIAGEDQRRRLHDEKIAAITLAINRHEEHVERIKADQELERLAKIEAAKRTWQTHEALVKQEIQNICRELNIAYVDDFPNKDPDNVVKIADEYIVFDAKSPRGEDLASFFEYLKDQAKTIKKYLAVKEVRKELFLVVPDNCLEVIKSFHLPFADYRVYIVSLSTLTPIIATLKRMEDYEFAQSLSPAEREQIVTYLGKTSYLFKRRIQIDHFFAHETLSLLSQKENLPDVFFLEQEKIEKASVLNPPMDKSKKLISLSDLVATQMRLEREISALRADYSEKLAE